MRHQFAFLLGLFVLAIAAAPAAYAQQGANVALVIGNATYPDSESPLKEPVTDAHALGDELRRRGFDVDVGENLKKEPMQKALDRFYGKITSSSTAVLFFSGFGIQSDRQSYMIPVDAQIWDEKDVRRDGFSLDKVLSELTTRGAQVKIAIIDASRRNPFERRFRSVSAGLAAITAPRGTVVMTSAPPDTVVSDGSTPVFMTELINELKVTDATIEQVFNRTRMDVSRDTKAQQVPWFSSSLEEDIPIGGRPHATASAAPVSPPPTANKPPPVAATKPASPPVTAAKPVAPPPVATTAPPPIATTSPDPEADARHDYVLAENLGTRQGWNDFIKKHPTGYYAELAMEQLAKLPEQSAKLSSPDDFDPTDLPGFYRRGQQRAVRGEYTKSIEDFDEVLRRDPRHAGALNNRCWVRGLVGDLQNALKDCNEALRIAPNYPDALDSRGMVNLKLGMFGESIADYTAALQIEPKKVSALYGRGIAEQRSGKSSAGNRDVDDAKAIKSNIADEFAGYGIR